MPFLSPAKLLIVVLVAIVVLGPDKLPKVARQVGSLWGDFRRLRERLESDVRGNFPDLPSTDKITQAVRSPISFLDSLADTHAADNGAARPGDEGPPPDPVGDDVVASGGTNRPNGAVRADESTSVPGVTISDPEGTVRPADPAGAVHALRDRGPVVPDDPSMN